MTEQSPHPAPPDAAAALARFADALLPGDELFPAASAVGAQGVMAARLRERVSADAPVLLARDFIRCGGLDDPDRAAARLEVEEPRGFDFARALLSFAYYEAPAVIAAIRALGHTYNDAPQPLGYPMRAFDPAREAPAVPRGRYVATAEVTRVDLSGLALAAEPHR